MCQRPWNAKSVMLVSLRGHLHYSVFILLHSMWWMMDLWAVCALARSLSLSQLSRLPERLQGLCQPCSSFLLMPPWSTFTDNLCTTHVASHCAFLELNKTGDLRGQTVKHGIPGQKDYLLVVQAKANITAAHIYEFKHSLTSVLKFLHITHPILIGIALNYSPGVTCLCTHEW